MALKKLLLLQLLYCLSGIAFNVVNYFVISGGGRPMSPLDPLMGMIFMSAYGLCLLPGRFRFMAFYRILMALCVVVFGYGGVVKNIINVAGGHWDMYRSTATWAIGSGINLFGLILNVIAAAGWFKSGPKA